MRPLLFTLVVCFVLVRGAAFAETAPPTTDRAAIVQVVQSFFDALQAKDGARLRATCQPGAQITSIRPGADGANAIRQRSIETDAEQLTASPDSWLERMWSPTVHLDGRIAVVWTRYDFHRNGRMSHNGTDCFTLLKTDAGWKIASAAYTVEPSAQTQNPAGPPR
ncbi:MAG: nuclear transport factor 2 family protein [Verrucomicrobia bacterium]|nr:nuclear transport factor 2 family protein [Verrucomicrobiota bacterium]